MVSSVASRWTTGRGGLGSEQNGAAHTGSELGEAGGSGAGSSRLLDQRPWHLPGEGPQSKGGSCQNNEHPTLLPDILLVAPLPFASGSLERHTSAR